MLGDVRSICSTWGVLEYFENDSVLAEWKSFVVIEDVW